MSGKLQSLWNCKFLLYSIAVTNCDDLDIF